MLFLSQILSSIKENPSYYARVRMLEELEKDSYISYRGYGYIEDLEKLDNKYLYDYYKSVLENDIVDIFVIGDVNSSQIEKLINEKFRIITTSKKTSESHFVKPTKNRKLIHVVKEKQHINQSKLMIGCKIDEMTEFETKYVLNVYSYILGGGPDSKLFKNIREKYSLCYHISSGALRLIKKEVKNMREGKFSSEDIVNAKVTYINSLKELEDNPNSIINFYASMEYLNSDTLEEKLLKINRVTLNDVKLLARKIHMDTVYFLEGDIREKKTN